MRIASDRGKAHLHGLIGDGFAGVVGSDRFTAYNSLDPERRQVCWSHLRRDFTFHADLGLGPQETFGLDGLEVTWNVFQGISRRQRPDPMDLLRDHPRFILLASSRSKDGGESWTLLQEMKAQRRSP